VLLEKLRKKLIEGRGSSKRPKNDFGPPMNADKRRFQARLQHSCAASNASKQTAANSKSAFIGVHRRPFMFWPFSAASAACGRFLLQLLTVAAPIGDATATGSDLQNELAVINLTLNSLLK
jgi:hypothetical protein